jgi:intergrase/recombinase
VVLSTADLSSIVDESSDGIADGYLPRDDKIFILDMIREVSAEVTFVFKILAQ